MSTYRLPEPKASFTDTDHRRMGEHGLDKYAVEDIRWQVYAELLEQFGDPDVGSGRKFYNLIEWRDAMEYDVSDMEDAIWFLREIDRFPIEMGPTAFVGWYERWEGDRVDS